LNIERIKSTKEERNDKIDSKKYYLLKTIENTIVLFNVKVYMNPSSYNSHFEAESKRNIIMIRKERKVSFRISIILFDFCSNGRNRSKTARYCN